MRELQYYRPIIKFYVSENTSNVIDNRGLNILISKIKDNHGLKSRDRNEIKDYLVKHFVKKIISGKLYQFSDEADILDISSVTSKFSFFSYQTSLYIHSLTDKISNNIYLVKERKEIRKQPQISIAQNAIDLSFSKPQKMTSNKKEIEGFTINIISGQFQNHIGVQKHKQYFISDIERTLIDCVVRPLYAGGVQEILKAFALAKEKIDVAKLYEYYSKMSFTYPFNQSIGFYLEMAGYDKSSYEPFLYHQKSDFDFYLDYNMEKKRYNNKWKIFFPENLKI